MKKTIKLLSFVLLLAIFIQSYSFSAFAFNVSEDLLDEYKLLESIGIFNNTNIDAGATYITRAQFVVSVFNLLHLNRDLFSPVKDYDDVKSDHFAYKEITAFKNMDYISGVGGNKFSPDEYVTMQQGVKILICALGSKPAAEGRGGHPRGYVEVAKSLKIWDSSYGLDDYMTGDNFVKLLCDTLETSPLTITGVEGDYIIYETDRDKTIFSEYYDIYEANGKLTQINLKDIDSDAHPTVVIGDKVYKIGDVDVYNYLGLSVNVYYEQKEGSEEKTIVFVSEQDGLETLKLSDDDILDYNSNTYTYEADNKEKQAKVKTDADIYYNGVKISYFKELMMPENGTVTLVKYADVQGTGYDAVVIENNVLAVLRSGVLSDNSVVFENNISYYQIENDTLTKKTANSIKPSEASDFYFRIVDDKGVLSDVSALKEKTVVSVGINPYYSGAKLTYCQKVVTGKITAISSDFETVTINDTEYDVKFGIIEKDDLYLGLNATFMLDFDDNIVYFKNNGNGYSKGFIVRAYLPDDVASPKVKAVIYDIETKSVFETEIDEKVKINGLNTDVEKDSQAQALQDMCRRNFRTSATTNYVSFEALQYKVNSDNILTEINFVGSTVLPDFKRINTYEAGISELLVRHQMYTIGDAVLFSDNTLFMWLPYTDKTTEEYIDYSEYYINPRTKYLLASDTKVNTTCDIYYFDDDLYADLIVRYGLNLKSPSENDSYSEYRMPPGTFTEHAVVTKISKAVTSLGEITDKISLMTLKGVEEEYVVSPKYASDINGDFSLMEADLSVGDITTYYLKDDLAGNFVKVYDMSKEKPLDAFLGTPLTYLNTWSVNPSKNAAVDALTATSGTYAATYRMTVGYVYDIKDDVISIARGNTPDDTNLGVFRLGEAPVIVCDSTTGKENIKLGSIADIKSAVNYGIDASRVLVYIKSGKIAAYVIYND